MHISPPFVLAALSSIGDAFPMGTDASWLADFCSNVTGSSSRDFPRLHNISDMILNACARECTRPAKLFEFMGQPVGTLVHQYRAGRQLKHCRTGCAISLSAGNYNGSVSVEKSKLWEGHIAYYARHNTLYLVEEDCELQCPEPERFRELGARFGVGKRRIVVPEREPLPKSDCWELEEIAACRDSCEAEHSPDTKSQDRKELDQQSRDSI